MVERVQLSGQNGKRVFHILRDTKRVKAKETCRFWWFKGNKVHQSMGDFGGPVLHGQYSAYFPGNQLRSKGQFRKGLKKGTWIYWHENGELKRIEEWKRGKLHGSVIIYDLKGRKKEAKKFKKGKLHGKLMKWKGDSLVSIEKFRKGKKKTTEENATKGASPQNPNQEEKARNNTGEKKDEDL